MQPYFFPYVGYFQLIGAVDLFVVYDNIKYTKKGWINRNRILQNGKSVTITLPLKGDSDSLHVRDRELATDYGPDKLLNQLKGAYQRAPQFEPTFALVERVMRGGERNLFRFLHNSIVETCRHLGIATDIRISSGIAIDHELKNQDKVLTLCEALGATQYVNAIGGAELYSREAFQARGIDLKFIRASPFEYPQFGGAFVPWLSIIDVLMFNSLDAVRGFLAKDFELV